MTDTAPAPTPEVEALAAERGLGAWARATYPPKKAVFSRKWEDARLYIFQKGLVVTGPDRFRAAYDWETARVLQCLVMTNGAMTDARYTLFDDSGAAVEIGRGNGALPLARQRARVGITSLVKGAPFTGEGDWGPYVQQSVARAQLPRVLARIEQGGTVDLGAVRLSREGVATKKRSVGWSGSLEVRMSQSLISVVDASDGKTLLPALPSTEVVNLELFVAAFRCLSR